ncbi:hypothetical protein [Spirosoma sordidisoli]|uniref:Uncharacterized protein n=1 Tax=Spirosoma sordidisoli TaxID=2502893 RepID=A0A4Q2UKL5_9BACT|nr:hypothetical protein [Spirosoma sordidisoli]RYC69756.1 hypothetical protein EQG79_14265 [Spirosoma sordidisoli]
MAKLSTQLALRVLLTDDDYLRTWLEAGYTKEDRSRLKYRFDRDQLSLDLMEEILTRCGFTVAVEKQWNRPQKGH